MSSSGEAWWVAAFRDEYVDVYPHRDLASARVEVAWLVEHGVGGRTLDLCCGFGRHTLALVERGIDVYGMDLSWELLVRARELPNGERLDGRLTRGDAQRLPYRDAGFGTVVNLFSSFGYFGDEGDRRMLDEIVRVLANDGLLVMDTMNPARIRANLVPHSNSKRGALVLDEERSLADGGRRVEKTVKIVHPDGRTRSWLESVRMYEVDELAELLRERGLNVTHVDGGFAGENRGPGAPRQIVRARRTRYHPSKPL
ncbi:MAG: methyltransferase domain-containing protein [Planctomycetota bacterium]|nr:methyltransferase domain-containing protein [Planctomycetota bacterium]